MERVRKFKIFPPFWLITFLDCYLGHKWKRFILLSNSLTSLHFTNAFNKIDNYNSLSLTLVIKIIKTRHNNPSELKSVVSLSEDFFTIWEEVKRLRRLSSHTNLALWLLASQNSKNYSPHPIFQPKILFVQKFFFPD